MGHLTKLWTPIRWSTSCGKGNPKWTVGERSYKYINCSFMNREIKVGSTLHDFSQFSFLFFLLPFLFNIDSGSGSKLCDLLQSSQDIKICLWTKLKRNEDGFDMESVNDQWLQITRLLFEGAARMTCGQDLRLISEERLGQEVVQSLVHLLIGYSGPNGPDPWQMCSDVLGNNTTTLHWKIPPKPRG